MTPSTAAIIVISKLRAFVEFIEKSKHKTIYNMPQFQSLKTSIEEYDKLKIK